MVAVEKQRVTRVRLQEPSIETLAQSLLSGPVDGAALPEVSPSTTPAEAPLRHEGMVNEDHLQDDEFIAFSQQALDAPARERAERHLQTCDACAREVERIVRLSDIWADEDKVVNLERRILTAARIPPPDLLGGLLSTFRISLKPLLLPQAAFSEGQCDELVTLKFPITEHGQVVEGLVGVLTRANRKFYICVEEDDTEHKVPFANCEVWICLSNPREAHRILQRKIDVGVTVLLGTGLRLSEESQIEARLLPPGVLELAAQNGP